jgi:hypothetical protein
MITKAKQNKFFFQAQEKFVPKIRLSSEHTPRELWAPKWTPK